MTTSEIDLGHTRIAYHRAGEGPHLVFVHGWPLHGATWRNVVRALPRFTCHVIDLPGAGGSRSTAATPLSVMGHVESLDAVLDQLDLPRFTLIGHDRGGLIARYVAARCDDRLDALVLSGTEIPHRQSLLFKAFVRAGTLPGAKTVIRRALSSSTLTKLPIAFGGAVADRSLLDGELRELFIDPWIHDPVRLGEQLAVLRAFRMDDVRGLSAAHRQITAPTLLIWGEDDPFFPSADARVMAAEFAGPTEFVTVPGARLLVHEEHPDRFAELIGTFVDRVRAPDSGSQRVGG